MRAPPDRDVKVIEEWETYSQVFRVFRSSRQGFGAIWFCSTGVSVYERFDFRPRWMVGYGCGSLSEAREYIREHSRGRPIKMQRARRGGT